MAEEKKGGLSLLWKTEDWLAVWMGFLIIVVILAGLTVKIPKFKWTTEGAFTSYIENVKKSQAVEKLESASLDKNEAALKADLTLLREAIAANDRKAIGDAAKKLEETSKAVQDEGLKKKAGKLGKDIKGEAGNLPGKVFSGENIMLAIYIGIAYLILSVVALSLLGEQAGKIIAGFPVVFILAWIAQFIAGNYSILYYGVEYVLWCLFLGLFVSNVIGVPEWLKPAVRTEFYIKTGLVILGSGILFGEIVKAGFYGIVQAVLVVAVVWYFTWWIAKKMKVDDEFAAVLSSAVSICGVSAAIATGGAIQADSKKISYVTSIVLICAIPMLILQPIIAKAVGMSDIVAGAWLGGTLDTSGSVVAAGALISEAAMKTGVIVKMSQNVLIGVAAFILSVVWTLRACRIGATKQTPSAMEIWHRFPKFVLGFLVASVVFSFIVEPKTVETTKGMLSGLRTWWFALAFTSIGLETRFSDLAKMEGGRPAGAFLLGQGFNIIWTLILAWLLFSGIIFEVPDIK
ncbi:MAG: YeiH family protein [bacterium]